MLKIAKSLKSQGYTVWLDVEQMSGSTLEASMFSLPFFSSFCLFCLFYLVANAVENASCVLVCMTEKYKDSPNCRLEGEYTTSAKKKFIPLMLQKNFVPRGWY